MKQHIGVLGYLTSKSIGTFYLKTSTPNISNIINQFNIAKQIELNEKTLKVKVAPWNPL